MAKISLASGFRHGQDTRLYSGARVGVVGDRLNCYKERV